MANLIVTRFHQDNEQDGLGSSGLRLATKKAPSAAPFTLSEACGMGSYKCFGEGTVGGDYQGPRFISVTVSTAMSSFWKVQNLALLQLTL